MQNELNSTDQYDDEIDLRELFSVLWDGKKLIVGITAVFALVAVFYALSIPNQYRATALVSPAQGSGGGLSGSLGQLGGLASLAGVSIGGGESSEAQVAQEIMRSRGFIEEFISENNIDVEVFAAQGWDRGSNQLEINSDLYDAGSSQWVRDAPAGKTVEPTGWELYKGFSEMFSVSEDKTTGMISISVEYFSPEIAKQWVDQLIIGINQHMQSRKLDKVNINIQYLEAQIQKTSIAEMREVFYTIIEEQIKSKMLAEASPEYAFVTVSPAMVPEEKSQPKRALICILGTLLGGMLSVLWVLVMHYARSTTTAVGQ
ncbi:Wzz/FepE/Etk N-terminal domain-containing protein [Porticoccaceae bacterium]|nr:Wzz/FepE/Etk N-terminal domain-containing protein [Porticoccaceae bacterium]MDA9565708.1 Wzz/FepE/Etk N-terminal domain-containing protein [Porticoccaceae bacterium]